MNNDILSYLRTEEAENDFHVTLSHTDFPVSSGITRLNEALFCICLRGQGEFEIEMTKEIIERNAVMMLFPGQIVNIRTLSYGFEIMYFRVSAGAVEEVLRPLPLALVACLRQHPVCRKSPNHIVPDKKKMEILKGLFDEKENLCRREILVNSVRNFYLEEFNYIETVVKPSGNQRQRPAELFEIFVKLVKTHFKESREVVFYARKMNISSKYLSMIILKQEHKNAKRWIDDYVVSEIKLRLLSSDEPVQAIAIDLNFGDQSFLTKYFKRQTGMNPTCFRQNESRKEHNRRIF